SKSAIDDEMSGLLRELLRVTHVAVISGGDWPQFEAQILGHLPREANLDALSMLPTCGTKFFAFDGEWRKQYSEDLNADEKTLIVRALQEAVAQTGFKPERTWGEQIEDRGSQITFSALGQQAPLAEKTAYDPDFSKRKRIQAILDGTLSQFEVRLGGTT